MAGREQGSRRVPPENHSEQRLANAPAPPLGSPGRLRPFFDAAGEIADMLLELLEREAKCKQPLDIATRERQGHTALSFTVELVEEPDLCRRVRLWPEPSDGAT